MPKAAQVAVSGAAFNFDKLYTYGVDTALSQYVKIGSMVLVPFGKGTKPRIGVVLEVSEETPKIKGLKNIFDVAKEDVMLTSELLRLVYFLRERTFCTYYDAVKAIIPYGAQYKISFQGGVPTLQKQLTQTTVRAYNIVADSDKKLTEKQKTVFDFIGEKTALEENILNECCVTKAVLDTMVKNGVLNIVNIDKEFDVYSAEKCENLEINLSPQQTDAFTELVKMLQTNKPHACLLHGVTSSGKTLVFVKLLEEVLKKGKRAIVLVPEIGLTPQMVKRLKNAFGKKVAVVHSALGNTERLLQWQQIQHCEADIVVGTRSAVFAPVENLGLIIIDEEQEHTYRSEQAPRFLAHDVAKMRVTENNALLLLASATPSVESYYYANTGKYSLLEMSERYGNLPLPEVEIVDMRENLLLGNVGFLSARLREEICNNLNNDEQTILLLNRRGYQTVAICKNCAEVIKCENCSVPMVYHKAQNKLLCHHCGATTSPAPNICPKCGGEMKYTGYGTQKVEEELQGEFPNARILRMDLDSTTKKNAHEEMLSAFAKGEYDILIGTQMVAKGLDFEKVSLVGVVGVDSLLFSQGYKAFENVFSLVTQVVGRSGRSGYAEGRAIIQTLDPQNPVLNMAAKQNYKEFYTDEIAFRKMCLYPPFCALCMVCFSGEDESLTKAAAVKFSQMLSKAVEKFNTENPAKPIPVRLLGPTPFGIIMVNNKFRYKITVKCRNDTIFRKLLLAVQREFYKLDNFAKINVYFDFNSDSDM